MRFGFQHGGRQGRDCATRGMGRGRGFGGGFGGGWGHGPDGGRGGRGGGGRRRMFDGSELRLVLLSLIAATPRHGYDLIREIEALSGGAYAPSPGVVYPTLTMLVDMGLIEEQKTDGAKKQFAVTEAGTEQLTEQSETLKLLLTRLAELGSVSERTSGGPVRRAMGNLRSALQDRLTREDIDPDTLHQVAAIIDEAVQKIERL
jgi:DNA-binding PadR family transcriptional regulator